MNELSAFENRLATGLEAVAGPPRSVDATAIARAAASRAPVRSSVLSRLSAIIGLGERVRGSHLGGLGAGRSTRPLMVLIAVALITALVFGALAVGSGLVRLTSIVPPPSPEQPPAVAEGTGSILVLHHMVRGGNIAIPGTNNYEGQLWITKSDGSDAHELLPDRLPIQDGMAWSPDGARVVFSEAGHIYLTDAAGSSPQLIDKPCESSCVDRYPAFSPDGQRLVFNRTTGALPPRVETIATMDIDSGRVVELASTSISYSTNGHGPYGNGYQRPRWSPDGRRIVFSRWNVFYWGPDHLFVVDEDGTNLTELETPGVVPRDPEYSPDGSRIVFSSVVGAPGTDRFELDIYTIRADGTDLRRLTNDGVSSGATWVDDERIAFTKVIAASTARGGSPRTGSLQAQIWTMAADGTGPVELAALRAAERLLFPEDVAVQPIQ